MNMHDSVVQRSEPETAVAITENLIGFERPHETWQRIRLGFPINESPDSAVPDNQRCVINVFNKPSFAARVAGQWKEFWWTRFPTPQSILPRCPEISPFVFKQTEHSASECAILSITLDGAVVNCAKFPKTRRSHKRTGPNSALTVF